MPEDSNGHADGASRLDRIKGAMELFIADHEEFRNEQKNLLRSQVLMQDHLEKLAKAQTVTEERLNALITVIDDLVRRRS